MNDQAANRTDGSTNRHLPRQWFAQILVDSKVCPVNLALRTDGQVSVTVTSPDANGEMVASSKAVGRVEPVGLFDGYLSAAIQLCTDAGIGPFLATPKCVPLPPLEQGRTVLLKSLFGPAGVYEEENPLAPITMVEIMFEQ